MRVVRFTEADVRVLSFIHSLIVTHASTHAQVVGTAPVTQEPTGFTPLGKSERSHTSTRGMQSHAFKLEWIEKMN